MTYLQKYGIQLLPLLQSLFPSPILVSVLPGNYLRLRRNHSLNVLSEASVDAEELKQKQVFRYSHSLIVTRHSKTSKKYAAIQVIFCFHHSGSETGENKKPIIFSFAIPNVYALLVQKSFVQHKTRFKSEN